MLDYNHRPSFAEHVNAAVDRALIADQATRPPRDYLGGSRLGLASFRAGLHVEQVDHLPADLRLGTFQALQVVGTDDLLKGPVPACAERPWREPMHRLCE